MHDLGCPEQDAHREEERELKVDRRGLRLGAKGMGLR